MTHDQPPSPHSVDHQGRAPQQPGPPFGGVPQSPPPYPPGTYPGVPGGYYQQPFAPAPLPTQTAPNATAVLILGLLGMFVLPILSPFAWYLGAKSRRQIKQAPPNTYRDTGFVDAGWLMGIIGTGLLILAILTIGFFIFTFMAADIPT